MCIPQKPTSLMLAMASLVVLAACNSDQSRVAVRGNVTVDGAALPKGTIIFKPNASDSGPQAAAEINNGSYVLDGNNGPGLGGYDVLVYADQPLNFEMDEPGEFFARSDLDLPDNSIPAEYNTRTTLNVVTQPGDNEFNFAISKASSQ